MDGRERESCEDGRVIVWTVGREKFARIDGLGGETCRWMKGLEDIRMGG